MLQIHTLTLKEQRLFINIYNLKKLSNIFCLQYFLAVMSRHRLSIRALHLGLCKNFRLARLELLRLYCICFLKVFYKTFYLAPRIWAQGIVNHTNKIIFNYLKNLAIVLLSICLLLLTYSTMLYFLLANENRHANFQCKPHRKSAMANAICYYKLMWVKSFIGKNKKKQSTLNLKKLKLKVPTFMYIYCFRNFSSILAHKSFKSYTNSNFLILSHKSEILYISFIHNSSSFLQCEIRFRILYCFACILSPTETQHVKTQKFKNFGGSHFVAFLITLNKFSSWIFK